MGRRGSRPPKWPRPRKALVLPRLDAWLGAYFAPHRRPETIAVLAAASAAGPAEDAIAAVAEQTIGECDRKIARYRVALEALDDSVDPVIVAGWISEAQRRRGAAEEQLHHRPRQERMSESELAALVGDLAGRVEAISGADPRLKADLYARLGLHLTYHPAQRTVRAEAHLDPAPYEELVRVRGRTRTNSPSIVLPLGSIPFDVSSLVEQAED